MSVLVHTHLQTLLSHLKYYMVTVKSISQLSSKRSLHIVKHLTQADLFHIIPDHENVYSAHAACAGMPSLVVYMLLYNGLKFKWSEHADNDGVIKKSSIASS